MGVTIAMMTIVALAGSGIYLGLKTLENYNPGRSKIQKDLAFLRADLKPLRSELVPWTEEEMSQLSLTTIHKKAVKQIAATTKGIFTTIYHEPLIAWAYRKYVASKENALILAATSHHEFIYRVKKGTTEIVIDDELVGHVDQNNVLYPTKGNKPLAALLPAKEGHGRAILIGDREFGRLSDPGKASGAAPRAFLMVSEMDAETEKIFLAMTVLDIVKREI